MKKPIALSLALAMTTSLIACGGPAPSQEPNAGNNVTPETAAESNSAQEKITVRINCTNSANSPVGEGYALLAELLEKNSNGVFDCEVYYDGTYCSGTEALTEMALGNLEIGGSGATYTAEYVPQYGFLQMAYLFDSYEHALAALNGEIGQKIFQEIAEVSGQLPLGAYYYGSRNIMLSKDKCVSGPEDLKGVKMRTNGSDSMITMMTAMGANPVTVSLSETYTALQTGVVDGQENPISGCLNFAFPEVSKSWTYTEHYFDCTWIACSYKWYTGLSEELQDVVKQSVKEACGSLTETILTVEASTDEVLEDAGVSVYRIDKTSFKEATEAYYEKNLYADWDIELMKDIMELKY